MKLSHVDEWPSFAITVELLPWHWRIRPRLYADDVDGWFGYSTVEWLCFTVKWMANRPAFTEAPTAPVLISGVEVGRMASEVNGRKVDHWGMS